MSLPNILFKGIPRGPTRGYTADVIQAKQPKVVVIPCCGSFSLAHVAREAGMLAEAIVCGDVSLYSTALGRAITDTEWRLEVKDGTPVDGLAEVIRGRLGDPISSAAAVLFTIRVLQYQKKTQKQFHRDHQRELILNAEAYIAQLQVQTERLVEELRGTRYLAQDMWITLDEYRDDPEALLLVNPPRYDGGYERMFKGLGDVFDWDEPDYAMFKERDYERLMASLGQSQATTLMYYATQGEDPTPLWGEPWRSVFAHKPGRSKHQAINWIVANKSPVPHAALRTRLERGESKYVLFNGEVKSDSQMWAQIIERAIGDYYRDLFIHKLAGSLCERYAGLFLDGCLLAVVGLHLKGFRTKGWPAGIVFAFTTPQDIYSRLHKLTLNAVISSWFWRDVLGGWRNYALGGIPERVQTTMLTPHPENKTARGVLKLANRERQPDGKFKLTYYADIRDRTREETLRAWRKRFGSQRK